jgi:hypothetical protein
MYNKAKVAKSAKAARGVRMHFQFEVAPMLDLTPKDALPATVSPSATLQQLLTAQLQQLETSQSILAYVEQQLQVMRENAAMHDSVARWKAFLARWESEYPNVANACRLVLPQLERAYLTLIHDLTHHLLDQGEDALETDFALQDYLDRYGMRLSQLGAILSLVGPLAEVANSGETS